MSARFLSVYLFTHLQSPASRRRGASGIIYKHEHGTDVRTGIAALSADLNWKLINPLQADAASFQRQPDGRSDGWHVGGCARLARAPSWWHPTRQTVESCASCGTLPVHFAGRKSCGGTLDDFCHSAVFLLCGILLAKKWFI